MTEVLPLLTLTPLMPAPPLVAMVPDTEYVVADAVPVKFWPLTLAPLTVTARLVGENV